MMSFVVKTQESKSITRYKPGLMWNFTGLRPAKSGKAEKYDRLVFDITYNKYGNAPSSFTSLFSSIGLNTNFLFDIPINAFGHVSVATGLRHSLFRTENNIEYSLKSTHYKNKSETESVILKHKLLGGNSIGIPFEIRLRTKSVNHLKLHIGTALSYQWNVFDKMVSGKMASRKVVKEFYKTEYNRMQVSAYVRVGFRNWGLFTSYMLNPLFKNRKDTNPHLLQAGLNVSLF
jgi:hypothetical protein